MLSFSGIIHLTKIYLFKDDNKDTRKRCKICSKLTIKTTERHIINVVLVFLLLTLDIFRTFL